MTFRLGELFCGPGGIGWGAKNAKIKSGDYLYSITHAWATDYDTDTCETYRLNICPNYPKSVLCKDIRRLDMETLAKVSDIDGLAFGFPCNDFSVVGEQKGINGVYGPLYSYGIKALDFFKPQWFLAENVGGLRNSNEGMAFKNILYELTEVGYKIVPHLYKFEEYGVPQARHRIIIIGIRNDIDVKYRVPSTEPYKNIDISSKNAIENPPILPSAKNHTFTNHAETVIERLKYIKPGENAFNADIPKRLRLNVKGAKISQIYKRLDPDQPAYTITGSGGGGTHVYHWEEDRALTNRERARLQTFPDTFEFIGSKQSVRKQIGMAVPPQGSRIIFEALLKTFAGIDYPTIESNIGYSESLFTKSNQESY
ncbi:MAG: DNA (cytosine-5-)-methyltransferase [Chloroflexota bacterium]|nr:DNA (cytosine-5-)-methyltransferase [Chloroflexota bacterium]